jgi:hypothetical protein
VFRPFKDLYQVTSEHVTTMWIHDLNTGSQNLAMKLVGSSILMKSKTTKNSPYVEVTHEDLG